MRIPPAIACLIAASLVGCGGVEAPIGMKPPHGGTIAGLPNDLGKIEIVRQAVDGQPNQSRLVLYFLDPSGEPMKSPPISASFKPKDRKAQPVVLKAGTDGALESPPMEATGDIVGELTAPINGSPVTLSISVR